MGMDVVDAEKASALNVTESVLDYLSGRKGATYPTSAGTVYNDAGVKKRWDELYPNAATPRIAHRDVALDDILAQASPLLMVTPAETGVPDDMVGGMTSLQSFSLSVLLFCRVWSSSSGDRLDHRATMRQFSVAQGVVQRLLQAAHGHIPLWDHTKATDALIYAARIGGLWLPSNTQRPLNYADRYEARWNLAVLLQREAD